ncbi:MAG TPA: hypothetical protein VN843_23295 [Anaerolineales bacterium]|nr:hypothetical protein [Anaerolineales bacterium]
MGDTEAKDKNIKIHNVIGGISGKALIECYFNRHGNTYTFYDKDGNEKAADIKVGEDFWFTLDEVPDVNWTLSITNPVGPDRLLGKWSDSANPTLADGSYQAEAGGSGEEEEPNVASAGACS